MGVFLVWRFCLFLVCFWIKRADSAKAALYEKFVKRELVPRPGFEPGSWARKAHILDRARLPVGVAGAGYGPRTARAVSLCLWNKNFIPSCTGVLVGLS